MIIQEKIEEFYAQDILLAVNVIWLIIAVFFPFALYYVMLKLSLAVDRHIRHKKEIYSSLKTGLRSKEEFESFPTNTLAYYWPYLISGLVLFMVALYYPVNLETLSIPTPTLIGLIVNFFFLVTLSDVISKRFYVHQEMEAEIDKELTGGENERIFKKRSGFGFMLLSFLTAGIYVYIYLFLVNREYVNHVVKDYERVKRMTGGPSQ